ADLTEIEREKVEEERAICLRRQRQHLPLHRRREVVEDELEIRRLSAETRPVIDDLCRQLACAVVEEDHQPRRIVWGALATRAPVPRCNIRKGTSIIKSPAPKG